MKPLLNTNGKQILESFSFTKTLYAFDFDGTLCPIVKDPESVKVVDKTIQLLNLLKQHAPVAIISGRSLKDLRPKINFKATYMIGNHGLEGLENGAEEQEKAKETCQDWRHKLEGPIKRLEDPGVFLEDKIYSLALHYRKSRNKKKAKLALLEMLTKIQNPPRLIMGKSVINLVPQGAPHKGVALLELMIMAKTKTAFYIGDDDTDEDIFTLPNSRILKVRVGRKEKSNAQYYIDNQHKINELLITILGFYK